MPDPGPRRSAAGLLLALGLVAVGTHAQQVPSADRARPAAESDAGRTLILTREEAVALALSNSRQLQSLDTDVEIQEHRGSARGLDNPEIRLRNLSTRSADEQFDELELGLRWRPPVPGEAAVERQQGQVRLWESKVEAQRSRDWLASRVRRAWSDVVMYRELVRIASERVDNETRRIAQIETMVDLGRRSIVYYTKARATLSAARNEHTRRLLALLDEERRLQRLTGAAAPVGVSGEPLPAVTVSREALLAIAYTHRPEVELVAARQQLAVRQHSLELWRRLPRLSFVEVSRHREEEAGDWHELMLGLEIPLFGLSGGRAHAASLEIGRRETQVRALYERLEDEVNESHAAYSEALLAWQLARDDGQALAEEASRVIAEASRHGTIPADEVLELERAIMDTRVVAARRRRELAHAVWFLWYTLGIQRPEQVSGPPDP